MIIKLGQVLTPSLTCIQLSYMFVNNNIRPQLIKMSFACFSQHLKHPSTGMYIKLHKHLEFDGPMCNHVFKCF